MTHFQQAIGFIMLMLALAGIGLAMANIKVSPISVKTVWSLLTMAAFIAALIIGVEVQSVLLRG